MHAAHALTRRPALLTVPALGDQAASQPAQPAQVAKAEASQPGYDPAMGFYLILFSILSALVFGVFVPV